jgi:hypothetical protein
MRRSALLLTGLLLSSVAGAAVVGAAPRQDVPLPEVNVTLDRTRVTVGDPIALTVTVKHATGVTIETTSIDDQLGPLEPLGSDPPEDRAVSGGMELRLRYTVAVYHTGTAELPALTFNYLLPDGSEQQVSSRGPVQIVVQSVLTAGSDPNDIRPLKPQASLPTPASEQLLWVAGLGGIAAAAVAVGGLTALLVKRNRRPVFVMQPSAGEIARAELDRIASLQFTVNGELAEHYRLTAICIRRYLTERFGFPAVALTTGELERQMEARGIARWPARLISGLLSECDAVTYARYRPAAARIEADNAMAYEILDETDAAAARPLVQAI